jgi:hypothetical protein
MTLYMRRWELAKPDTRNICIVDHIWDEQNDKACKWWQDISAIGQTKDMETKHLHCKMTWRVTNGKLHVKLVRHKKRHTSTSIAKREKEKINGSFMSEWRYTDAANIAHVRTMLRFVKKRQPCVWLVTACFRYNMSCWAQTRYTREKLDKQASSRVCKATPWHRAAFCVKLRWCTCKRMINERMSGQ